MKGGVGFASSVTQAKAAQAKKQRKAAAIPTTPAITATVAKIREGNPLNEPDPNHDGVRQCWREIVVEMKLVRRDMRIRQLEQVAKVAAPVRESPVLETIIQVIEEVEPAPVVKASPLPEKVEDANVEPLLLPAETPTHRRAFQRSISRIRIPRATPAIIELPANTAEIAGYLPAKISDNWKTAAMVQRQAVRTAHGLEHGVEMPPAPVMNVGKRQFWMRNPDGTMEKRAVGE